MKLSEFDALVKLEGLISMEAETVRVPMSARMWGFTYTNRQLGRCRIHLNSRLPRFWQSFALFHEIHHLLHDSRGCYFWAQTRANMSGFEYRADQFAWAVLMDEWCDGDEDDGVFGQ
jgi:Zn-dependent peptidase ImmA (M78 family)